MTDAEIAAARADIEATDDLLERAMLKAFGGCRIPAWAERREACR